jgi:hypothetical protein
MLIIEENHLQIFETIKRLFLSKTEVPEKDNWKAQTNNDIWLKLITQVIVVGSSTPAHRFNNSPDLKKQVSYNKLLEIENQEELELIINRVLRAVGTRYASFDISKCRKTKALAHNLTILKDFKEGPKGLLTKLSEFKEKNSDQERIRYLMKNFKYLQSKSARDYLMELGLIQNAIALDVRIRTILTKVGISPPKGFENNHRLYDQIEKDLLNHICVPLELSGVEFDRMLYQNYENILTMLNKYALAS